LDLGRIFPGSKAAIAKFFSDLEVFLCIRANNGFGVSMKAAREPTGARHSITI
jgi:hypothetical protein